MSEENGAEFSDARKNQRDFDFVNKPEKKNNPNCITLSDGRQILKSDIFKFLGLVAFFLIMAAAIVFLWPLFGSVFEEGGTDLVIEEVRNAGAVGVFMLLGLQFLQIVVAFVPGEVVQIVAGILYGPWLGSLLLLLGCLISSAFIFVLVRKLGAPFVQGMAPTNQLERFRKFEETGRLNIIVFILFLIPGLPKDVFTYIVPLTDMKMGTFLALALVGRTPGIVVTAYAADGLVEGRIMESVIIFAFAAVICAVGVLMRKHILGFLEKRIHRKKN